MRSGLKALILVSRQFGINIGPNDIQERYNVDDRELSLAELASVVQKFDLRAKPTKVNEPQLAKALLKKQQILRLSTGRYIIALRYTQEKDGSRTLLILDPSQPESKSQTIDINEVKKVWRGGLGMTDRSDQPNKQIPDQTNSRSKAKTNPRQVRCSRV